ncbi:MAG: RagB/SusD family nutrient uptake outer membrane protein [Bacteroidales bacterium]|nr:RagB/SusD family nutrient uptake outer membrane protein [Bacteroidales bacterium]
MILKNAIYGLAAGALCVSCSLDYEPIDTYSDLTYTTEASDDEEEVVFPDKASVESYMQKIYKQLNERQEHWYLDLLLIAEAHSDNAYAGTTGAEVVPYEDNSIDGSNSVLNRDWNRYLEDVALANKLVVNIDKVADGSLSEADALEYKAQAQIFRSMIWFEMVRLWGNIPVIKTIAADITADNIEESYEAYFPAQNTIAEAYSTIEADLLEAVKYAPDQTSDKTKLTKNVARTLLAKMYAEKPIRDYTKVIEYVDAITAEGFELVDDLNTIFGFDDETKDAVARNTKESILEVQFFPGSGNWATWMFGRNLANWDENFTWAKWVTPSRDLIKLYESQGDTKRMEQSIVYYECTWSNYYPMETYPFMYKLRSGNNSIIKFRYADVLLLKAEALIAQGKLSDAASIINQVRKRAGLGILDSSVANNADDLLDAYLDERRMELAFEGQRWFDLVRLDKVEKVMNAVYAKDSGRTAQRNLFNENSYLMPLPQAVLDANENLIQNPGY